MAEHIQNVALVGASGNLGSAVLEALLKQGKHNITVITRQSSKAEFPKNVSVKKGDYNDAAFFESALAEQEFLIIMLGFGGLATESTIFEAAARAGVRYVMPSEYGKPMGSEKVLKVVPLLRAKKAGHDKIEALGMKWIGVASNSWIDYSLQYGTFDIQIPERKATLYTDSGYFNTTSIPQVAASISALLALPVKQIDETFANSYLYVSSFYLTQPDLFSAVLRATGTTEADWQVDRKKCQDLIDEGDAMVARGELAGHFKVVYGATFAPGLGGDYNKKLHNAMLGLPEEDLDAVVKAAVKVARPGGWSEGSTLKLG